MQLIRVHVENFGKLHDESIDFRPGFRLIDEPNGWGKSTLAAFIRVMFFGFEGETKRKNIENERRRYQPWQGGAYGGSLTFEIGGKVYIVTRIFGDKSVNDSFELRDADTNLLSDDFSEKLGEEIFKINGESFARTVFLAQNDCATVTTDSINARIGNITDNMNDLESFEKANAALQDVLNKLNPRRKTGTLSRMNDEITRLTTEVSQNTSLEESIKTCEAGERTARDQLWEKQAQQERLYAMQRQASRAQDKKIKQTAYRQLCVDCEEKEAEVHRTEAAFPGEIPSEEEIRSAMDSWDEMAMLKAVTDRQSKDQAAEKGYSTGQTGYIIVGVICGLLGVLFRRQLSWPWIILLAIGAMLVIVGLVLLYRKNHNKGSDKSDRQYRGNDASSGINITPESNTNTGEGRDNTASSGINSSYGRESGGNNLLTQLDRLGLEPTEDVKDQLMELLKLRVEWQRAGQDTAAARLKKEEFESANDMDALLAAETLDNLPSMEELNSLQRRLETEIAGLKRQADGYSRQLAALREKYDEWQEMSERLENMKDERKRLRQQYSHVQLAQKYLASARESMTAKYMEPLMSSFSEYYEIVTGMPAEDYHMDANTKLTVSEQGMQRETVYLSRGYQDLIGLCLRLALTDAMYQGEKPFLILDDPLVNLDETNTAGGRRLLKKVAEKYQVIYFTCKGT